MNPLFDILGALLLGCFLAVIGWLLLFKTERFIRFLAIITTGSSHPEPQYSRRAVRLLGLVQLTLSLLWIIIYLVVIIKIVIDLLMGKSLPST